MIAKLISLAAATGVLAYAHGARADDDKDDDAACAPSTAPATNATNTTNPTSTTNTAATGATDTGNDYREVPAPYSYTWRDERLPSRIGVGLTLGGGVTGFTNQTMRDTTSSVGGLWDARVAIGTHVPIGLDINYIGTAANIDALNGSGSATLVGTTVEGALRWNILPHYAVDPYLFAGLGWQHYEVTNVTTRFADANIKSKDDLLEVPMGLGISFRNMSGFLFDLRGTFRAAGASTLVFDPRSGNFADMHTWEASGALGYEF